MISPTDRFREVEAEVLGWLDAGTLAVLVLDPRRGSATMYRAQGDVCVCDGKQERDLSDAVPGWRVAVADFLRLSARGFRPRPVSSTLLELRSGCLARDPLGAHAPLNAIGEPWCKSSSNRAETQGERRDIDLTAIAFDRLDNRVGDIIW